MVSSASRVFGIAELLEQILCDPRLDFRAVYRLQCVNKSFRDIIKDSPSLQRKMHITYSRTPHWLETHVGPIPRFRGLRKQNISTTLPALSIFLILEQLDLGPIHYRGVEIKKDIRNRKDWGKCVLPITLLFAMRFDIPRFRNDKVHDQKIGIKGNKIMDVKVHDWSCSWSKMLVTGGPSGLKTQLAVEIWGGGRKQGEYTEVVGLDGSQRATLGGLMQVLEVIKARTKVEHFDRLDELQAKAREGKKYASFEEALSTGFR